MAVGQTFYFLDPLVVLLELHAAHAYSFDGGLSTRSDRGRPDHCELVCWGLVEKGMKKLKWKYVVSKEC
jgi:hypothetical protein